MSPDVLVAYLKAVAAALQRGDATEHTHRPALKTLLESLAHYQKIVVALKETIRLMDEIDKAIPEWPLPGS